MYDSLNRISLKGMFAGVAVAAIACALVRAHEQFGPYYAALFLTVCGGVFALVKRHKSLAAVSVVAFLIVGMLGFDMVSMAGHPVPIGRLRRIRPGTTMVEVERLLGTPDRIRRRGHQWEYSGNTWCTVTVRFSSSDVVERVDHIHR